MLRFRLEELKDVVDYFVLVESDMTFNKNRKHFIFEDNKHLFDSYNIIHVKHFSSKFDSAWDNEKQQRNAIMDGLNVISPKFSDIIIINDVDEIPNRETLLSLKNSGIDTIYTLEQDIFYYNFNCKFDGSWYHPKIMNYKTLLDCGDPESARFSMCPTISNGGWHLTYFGDVDFIVNKIKNFSHTEYNNETYLNKSQIENCIKENKDLFLREGMEYTFTEISDEKLPKNYKMLL
jgi:beta-1,4-mannosyl-glycoprotein beta-1,4-N-acetylglucosaminyltransferase